MNCIDGTEIFRASSVTTHGYVQVSLGRRGLKARGHRLVWEECFGPIPDGMLVCHTCDNRSCVNPEHLFLGTPQDNMNDMVSKRRAAHGERHPLSTLSEADVLDIRQADGTQAQIAKRFGISQARVSKIIRGEGWGHLE